MRYAIFTFAVFFFVRCMGDNARFKICTVDERTAIPLPEMKVKAVFVDHFLRWENATVDHEIDGRTGIDGRYVATGNTNCGKAGFCFRDNDGFYDTRFVWVPFDANNGNPIHLLQWWNPDNQVVTVRLQRVEHPMPLWVKNVAPKVSPGTFDGTNAVLRYDLVLGDWLPPEGKGEHADLEIRAKLTIDEVLRAGRTRKKVFFEFWNEVDFVGEGNGCLEKMAEPTAGIKLRVAPDVGYTGKIVKRFGVRRKIVGPNINQDGYSDSDPNRCYYFRIRSRFDDKGNLVEAYYGKIYGDFNFHGRWDWGFQGVDFLYYLNPTPLDRNLEWDMKTNLCQGAGRYEGRQP